MRVGKIDVKKISKEHLYVGEKCTYLDIMLHENNEGKDRFGNDGFITQSVSKEAKAQGIKGPIIGNWRKLEPRGGTIGAAPVKEKAPKVEGGDDDSDSVPF
ncbi:MAG: hypothetical protein JW395_3791 [Nitrospira sp.]|nr:hypothetical protein [Nitrospira sp.]